MHIFKLFLLTLALALQIPLIATNKSTPNQRAAIIMQHLVPEFGKSTLNTKQSLSALDKAHYQELLKKISQQQIRQTVLAEHMLTNAYENSCYQQINLQHYPCSGSLHTVDHLTHSQTASFLRAYTPAEYKQATLVDLKDHAKIIHAIATTEEKYAKKGYITAYHGINQTMLLLVKINSLLAHHVDKFPKNFIKLRASKDFYQGNLSLTEWLNVHGSTLADTQWPYRNQLLSLNLAFPGNIYHTESSFLYYARNYSWGRDIQQHILLTFVAAYLPEITTPEYEPIKNLIFELTEAYEKTLTTTPTSAVLQIFVPENLAPSCMYLCHAGGQIIKNKTHANGWCDSSHFYSNKKITEFLKAYRKDCSSIQLNDLTKLQARFRLDAAIFNNPHSDLHFKLWHNFDDKIFTTLEKTLEDLVLNLILHKKNQQALIAFDEILQKTQQEPHTITVFKTIISHYARLITEHPTACHYCTHMLGKYCSSIEDYFTQEHMDALEQLVNQHPQCKNSEIAPQARALFTKLGETRAIAYAPDQKTFVIAGKDTALSVFNPLTAEKITKYNLHPLVAGQHYGVVRAVEYNHNGTLIASGGDDNNVIIYNPATRKALQTLPHSSAVRTLSWNADSTLLATGTFNGMITVWNTKTGLKLTEKKLGRHIFSLAWHPKKNLILVSPTTASKNNNSIYHAYVINTNLQPIKTMQLPGEIKTVGWNKEGSIMILGSADNNVYLWNFNDDKPFKNFKHNDFINHAALNNSETHLATCSDDGYTHIWDVSTGQRVLSLKESSRTLCAAWNHDSSQLTVGSGRGITHYHMPHTYEHQSLDQWLQDAQKNSLQKSARPSYIHLQKTPDYSLVLQKLAETKVGSLNRNEKIDLFKHNCILGNHNNKNIAKNSSDIRIATYNVHMWRAYEGKNFEAMITTIKNLNADILVLQEVFMQKWANTRYTQAELFEHFKKLGYTTMIFAPAQGMLANVILSKNSVTCLEKSVHRYKANSPRDIRSYARAVYQLPNGKKITVYGTHLDVYDLSGNTRAAQLQELVACMKKHNDSENVLVLADFNAVRKEDYAYTLEGKSAWDLVRQENASRNAPTPVHELAVLKNAGFIDSFTLTKTKNPPFTVWTGTIVDFIFTSQQWNLPCTKTGVYYSAASDHLPVILDINPK